MYFAQNKTKQQQQHQKTTTTTTKKQKIKIKYAPQKKQQKNNNKKTTTKSNKQTKNKQHKPANKRNKINPQKVISKEGLDTGVFVLPILIGLDTIYKCVRICIVFLHNNIFLKSYISGITVFYFKSWWCQLGIYSNPDRNSANMNKIQH
jgi:cation transport ATPase